MPIDSKVQATKITANTLDKLGVVMESRPIDFAICELHVGRNQFIHACPVIAFDWCCYHDDRKAPPIRELDFIYYFCAKPPGQNLRLASRGRWND